MQATQPQATIAVGSSVVYARERSRHPHEDVQVGKVLSDVNSRGEVMVDWPGLLHQPQIHPIYKPQMRMVAIGNLSVL